MGGEHHSAAMTEPDAPAKLWLVTCSCGWTASACLAGLRRASRSSIRASARPAPSTP